MTDLAFEALTLAKNIQDDIDRIQAAGNIYKFIDEAPKDKPLTLTPATLRLIDKAFHEADDQQLEQEHTIGALRAELTEKNDSLKIYRKVDKGGFIDWESWAWFGDHDEEEE